jgi:hypothetical protein
MRYWGVTVVSEADGRENSKTLDSWKEIAVFLRRGIRTVQRWERTEGLPIHRHKHLRRGSVYAVTSELITWRQARQLGVKFHRSSHRVGEILEQLDRLKSLTLQQAMLTNELRQLVAVRDRIEYYYDPVGRGEGSLPVDSPPTGTLLERGLGPTSRIAPARVA